MGFWGVNFTYAIFHVVEALRAAGTLPEDPVLQRASAWLLSKQKGDGGWGEHWRSCLTDSYVEHPQSQAAMTRHTAVSATIQPGARSRSRSLPELAVREATSVATSPPRTGLARVASV